MNTLGMTTKLAISKRKVVSAVVSRISGHFPPGIPKRRLKEISKHITNTFHSRITTHAEMKEIVRAAQRGFKKDPRVYFPPAKTMGKALTRQFSKRYRSLKTQAGGYSRFLMAWPNRARRMT